MSTLVVLVRLGIGRPGRMHGAAGVRVRPISQVCRDVEGCVGHGSAHVARCAVRGFRSARRYKSPVIIGVSPIAERVPLISFPAIPVSKKKKKKKWSADERGAMETSGNRLPRAGRTGLVNPSPRHRGMGRKVAGTGRADGTPASIPRVGLDVRFAPGDSGAPPAPVPSDR